MDTVQIAQKGKKQMIEVKNLTKYYGNHKAVDHISFSIKEGTVCGFLGPNGAGKSTTMNIMTGCLSATSGNVSIGEYDIFEQPIEAKKMIGYLPEQPPLYLEETPREYLRFVAQAKKIPRESIREEIENVMKETQITEVADRLIKNLSKGYRQRVGIAQTLLGNPKVIILDEPTVGLDPIQVIEIRDLIKSLGQKHTVILSSHILSEVQHMCDEILIISKGKLIAYDTAENLEKMMAPKASIEVLTDASLEECQKVLGLVLFIAHHLLNLAWYRNLFRGKYTVIRVLVSMVNLALLAVMICLMASGIIMSRHVFAFLPITGGMGTARLVHMVACYWGFVLMALHLGFHWGMMMTRTRNISGVTKPSGIRRVIFLISGIVIVGFGLYVFVTRDLVTYMFLRTQFVFLDYSESPISFYIDYLAMMGLFIWIAHYLSVVLKKYGKKLPQTNGKIAPEKVGNKKFRNM